MGGLNGNAKERSILLIVQKNEHKHLQTIGKDLAKGPRDLEIMVLQGARTIWGAPKMADANGNGAPKLAAVVLTKLAGNVDVDVVVN